MRKKKKYTSKKNDKKWPYLFDFFETLFDILIGAAEFIFEFKN